MKRLLPLVLLVCLGVACGSSHACAGREIVVRAVPQHGETLTSSGMDLAQSIISGRLDTLGVASARVTIRGEDEIVISGPVPKNLASVLSTTGQLQIFDFEKNLAAPTVKNGKPTPYPTLYSLLATPMTAVSHGAPEAFYLFDARAPHRVLQGPTGTFKELLAPFGGKAPAHTRIFFVPANHEVVSGPLETSATQPVRHSADGMYWYLFKLPPRITGADLKESAIQASIQPNTGLPQVMLGFNGHGAREFQAITKAEYDRGRNLAGRHGSAGQFNERFAQHSAILLDGKLVAVPFIDYTNPGLSHGIAGAAAVISNMGSMQAARRLALVLRSGSLPYRFVQVSSKLCGR